MNYTKEIISLTKSTSKWIQSPTTAEMILIIKIKISCSNKHNTAFKRRKWWLTFWKLRNAETHYKQNKFFSEPTRSTDLTSGDISKIFFSIYDSIVI